MYSPNIICTVTILVSGINQFIAPSVQANTIHIRQGVLEGTIKTARNGNRFNAYYGLPYAKPPVGELRFQPPQPAEPWTGTWNARVSNSMCIQIQGLYATQGEEDCLHLNVFTPVSAKSGDDIPVIVFVHGGSHKIGNNQREGPEYIMGLNVILVQMNFRLGFLGLMSTGDKVVPGNMALKDQTMALQWTRDNIRAFGGDPNRVTLAGHSSGAICVSLHTLSPLSNGLFQRVIILSGSAFDTYGVRSGKVARSMTLQVAEVLGCDRNSSTTEIVKCLQKVEATDIVLAQRNLSIWQSTEPALTDLPVVEDKNVRNGFLYKYSSKAEFASTSVQWLIGHTTHEGGYSAASYLSNGEVFMNELNAYNTLLSPIMNGHLWTARPEHISFTTQSLKSKYFGEEPIGPKTDHRFEKQISDVHYKVPVTKAVKLYRGSRHVYLYAYQSNFSTQLNDYSYPHYLGVAHVDDLQLYFKREDSAEFLSARDVAFGDEVLKRFVNFAHTSDPNEPYPINTTIMSSWAPVTSERIEYLRIDLKGSMETDLNKKIYTYFNSLPLFTNYE